MAEFGILAASLGFLLVTFLTGSFLERRHYASIRLREKESMGTPTMTSKAPTLVARATEARLAVGSVVVSHDYFKRFLAALRNFFGGRVASYEALLDRARREALLRMRASSPGADAFVNVRVETSAIGNNGTAKSGIGSVEAIAYGTALYFTTSVGSTIVPQG